MDLGDTIILGAGVTGLAAGYASGLPILEAAPHPGGLCSSYHAGADNVRLRFGERNPAHYRFEYGGGHWLFGVTPEQRKFLSKLCELQEYSRKSAVYFPASETGLKKSQTIPFPVQNHLDHFDPVLRQKIKSEILASTNSDNQSDGQQNDQLMTMRDWLLASFGQSLCQQFFFPFNDLYTAGLYDQISPQDSYKSPADLRQMLKDALNSEQSTSGYNATFLYPRNGNAELVDALAAKCVVHYGKEITAIDLSKKTVFCSDGSYYYFKKLISTLPLNKMISLCGLATESKAAPYTSVLVLNIGATCGEEYPDEHWLYVPQSNSGFHRIGFYNNVEPSFLPVQSAANSQAARTAIYVEKSFSGGQRPSAKEIEQFKASTIAELQQWQWIEEVEVAIADWIEVAYSWSWPNSSWREEALELLAEQDIIQTGRFASWLFQGIAQSILDGLAVGNSLIEKTA